MEEKLLRDFTLNSQYIDLEEWKNMMLRMMFRQFGMLRFHSKTRILQKLPWILFLGALAQGMLMASKIHLERLIADTIGEESQIARLGKHWNLQVKIHFSLPDTDSTKTSKAPSPKPSQKWLLGPMFWILRICQAALEMLVIWGLYRKSHNRHLMHLSSRNISLRKKHKLLKMQNQEDHRPFPTDQNFLTPRLFLKWSPKIKRITRPMVVMLQLWPHLLLRPFQFVLQNQLHQVRCHRSFLVRLLLRFCKMNIRSYWKSMKLLPRKINKWKKKLLSLNNYQKKIEEKYFYFYILRQ